MPASRGRNEPLSARAFRALLSLYPGTFRDEYGRELTLVFVDRYRDSTSRWEHIRLWLEAAIGILVEAPKEHGRMIRQDLQYAIRSLRKHGLVTTTIVVTLGLGIGANSAMFSLLNAVALRTLPVSDPDRLFAVRAGFPLASGNRFAGPVLERLRQSAPPDVAVVAMSRVARMHTRMERAVETEPASLQLVSPNYFDVLGRRPSLGQSLPPDDGSLIETPVAVVSHRYWLRRFGGAPDVLGRRLTINGAAVSIIGIAPQGFDGVWLESPVDIWVPLTMQRAVMYSQNYSADGADTSRPWLPQGRIWWLDVIARVPPERTGAAVSAFNAAALSPFNGAIPEALERDARIVLQPFARGFSTLRQQFATPLYVLIALAALVLLVACANVANLLLARAAGRQRELAVKMSLGADRARLVQELLAESVLVVLMAGAAALLVARWAGSLLVRTATASATSQAPFAATVDLRVWGFTAAVAFASVVLFGLFPAWRTTRLDLAAAIKAGQRGLSGRAATRPARLLVVIQVAVSLILVTGTGLLVRSFRNLTNANLGFERGHLLSVALDPRLAASRPQELAALQQRLLDGVASIPRVSSAALAMCGLHSNCRAREDGYQIEGYQAAPNEQILFLVNAVSPDYFKTVGMPIVAGRPLTERDVANGPKVTVVNRTLATRYFVDGQAVGRRFGFATRDVEIVGVVEDARQLNTRDAPVPAAFFPMAQRFGAARSLELRTSGDPRQAIDAVRGAVTRTAPDMPIEGIAPIDERISLTLSQDRLIVFLTSGFGLLALGLAGFGLFGLLSYAVARRGPEFGIRMALGASQSQVVWSVVREALWLVVFGSVLGAPVVLFGGGLASALFFGISPQDWATFAGATMTLLAVGCACSLIPALRAARVDPLIALREE